jgi:hypothetical protein
MGIGWGKICLGKCAMVVSAALVCCAPMAAAAQEDIGEVVPAENASAGATGGGEAPSRTVTVPALTEIAVEILADLGSRTSKQGDLFPLRLAAPIVIEGVELVPAGTPGMGEVIHAKRSGGSGAAGELVLAARYLEAGSRRLPLRSLRINADAKDRMTLAVAASMAFTPLGFFIKGDQLAVGAGSILPAKTAADFDLELPRLAEGPSTETSQPNEAAQEIETSSATGEEIQ